MTDTNANIYAVRVYHPDEVTSVAAKFGATIRRDLMEAAKRKKAIVVEITTTEVTCPDGKDEDDGAR